MNTKLPLVSFIVCTYNCEENVKRCFTSINNQDYPKDKIEILALDGGSTDKTNEISKSLGAKVIHNPAQYPEGEGRGKWLGFRKAKGEIVIFVDSDNALFEKNWIKNMINPLMNDEKVNFCICRMAVVKSDIAVNRYLSLIGTDPIAGYKSIDTMLGLRKIKLKDCGKYYTYRITPQNFVITGGYYFAVKKSTLEKIGGYTQDTDVVYRLAKKNMANVAIPKNTHVHHLIIDSLKNFFPKKVWWAKIYFREQRKGRDFDWIPNDFNSRLKLGLTFASSLLILPTMFTGIKMAFKDKEIAWLFHPYMSFLTAVAYLYAYGSSMLEK